MPVNPAGDLGCMLTIERLAGPGSRVTVHRSCCGFVATVFLDAEEFSEVLYLSRDGDTRAEAVFRLARDLETLLCRA